ncbi:unnamed protein product [Gongylonema pulchrum]|uniref:Uncharacterized protein n=1 Tax=Gongylonema pulchrum TaxID=637853 RepID=A0A183DPT8_9BILA|nr:unnamed protein product [Gongylonema pulchrum]
MDDEGLRGALELNTHRRGFDSRDFEHAAAASNQKLISRVSLSGIVFQAYLPCTFFMIDVLFWLRAVNLFEEHPVWSMLRRCCLSQGLPTPAPPC